MTSFRNLYRFTSMLAAVAMFLSLMITGCGSEGDSSRNATITPFSDSSARVRFVITPTEKDADAVTYDVIWMDQEGNIIGHQIFCGPNITGEGIKNYTVDGDKNIINLVIDEAGNVSQIHIDYLDENGEHVGSAYITGVELETGNGTNTFSDKETAGEGGFEFVSAADEAANGVVEVVAAPEAIKDGETTTLTSTYTYDNYFEKLVAAESVVYTSEPAENLKFDEADIATGVNATEAAIEATVTATAYNGAVGTVTVTVNPAGEVGTPTFAFYPEGATAATIADGTVEAVDNPYELELDGEVQFSAFICVGDPTSADSYTEIAREDVTASFADTSAEFVSIEDSQWIINGLAVTEEAQTLTVEYTPEGATEAETYTWDFTVAGEPVGAPTFAFYPEGATAATIADGTVTAIDNPYELSVGDEAQFTAFVCNGDAASADSYIEVPREDATATFVVETAEYVSVEDTQWIVNGITVTEAPQTMTIEYTLPRTTEALTFTWDFSVVTE